MRSLITPFLVSISLLAVPDTPVAVEVVQPEIAPADYSSPELAVPVDTVEPLTVGGLYSRAPTPTALPQPRALPAGYEGYHDYAAMKAEIDAAEIDHSAIVSVFSIGTSYEGRALWAAKVSDNVAVDEVEPEVVFAFGQHAREILTIEQALYALNMLTDGYGSDSAITAAVDNNELFILFNLNPDGSEYDKDSGLVFWRKNRQPNADATVGTDLNRNWGYHWEDCCIGSSDTPGDNDYQGASAFSARETAAVREFFASRVIDEEQQIKLFVDWHSFGEDILYPYGYTFVDVPADMNAVDHDVMVAMATAMAATNGYTSQQASDLGYLTDGASDDWAYGTYGIISFTFELSSTGSASGFYPFDSVIATETARNHDAILYLLNNAACPYVVVGRSDLCSLPPPPPVDTVGYVDGNGGWHLLDSSGVAMEPFLFGNPGDTPFMGDWNCDGVDTPGLYRASDGFVYLRNSNTQGIADITFFFGDAGDIPLAGDFNNDGCDTVSVYRPSIATIFIVNQLGANGGGLGAASHSFAFGDLGDRPFVADFDGDGFDTIGIHRNDGFVYYRNDLSQGAAQTSFFFGNDNDIFVAGDWNSDGIETSGVFRPLDLSFYLRNSNTQGNADVVVPFGVETAQPVSGSFG